MRTDLSYRRLRGARILVGLVTILIVVTVVPL
jgi:predicted nucleic acid-binding Zn ribbon protein